MTQREYILKEFTIDRSKLQRGEIVPSADGCACALAQYALACGFDVWAAYDLPGNELIYEASDNDNEEAVIAEFAKYGVTCTYVGEYRPGYLEEGEEAT